MHFQTWKLSTHPNCHIGLLFSLLGDIFLMFEGELMFICGLSSFLTAHIFYIFVFYNARTTKQNKTLLLFLVFFASSYYSYIYKEIFIQGGYVMLIAVLVYIIVITTMVYFAYLNNNTILTLGVTMFFISDSALAFDKFIINATDSKLEYLVMSTYHIAQLCIAQY
jgi:uncharacterized membrane protein YhhN